MPKPLKGESKEKYIERAVGDFRREGFEQQEAVGRAYGFWETYGKDKKETHPKRKKGTREK